MMATARRRGAPKGNTNAAKIGQDLRTELYLSKVRCRELAAWFEFNFGRLPTEDELRETVRTIANTAIETVLNDAFELAQPSRQPGNPEVF